MNSKLKKIITEEFNRSLKRKRDYNKTRAIVESIVREALNEKLYSKSEKSKRVSQVQDALSDPTVNKSALARKISGLSSDDDARRSEISKIARGEWVPDTSIVNDILHNLSTDK